MRGRLEVKMLSAAARRGTVRLGWLRLPCALGRSGKRALKREGDGATPIGRFRLVAVLYRPDRRPRPLTGLPVKVIRPEQGWCDHSADRNYNRQVRLPYPVSAERLWREDRVYDLVVVLDHNTRPRMRFGGSAIFIHVARPGYGPTEGCVALSEKHLALLLRGARPGATIVVPA
jgi:L,D-peptidoglycan transpeptidase YkuD (ErfK/YbiS/YcfS/YnhG family)